MKASPALLAATALVLASFASAQANSDKTPAPQAKPAPTTHRGGAPGHAGNGAPQPAPGMAITEQGISPTKHKPHTKVENSGDPHENMNGREAGSGMATGRRTTDANANANADIKAREHGSGMATGRSAPANANTNTHGRETGSGMATGRRSRTANTPANSNAQSNGTTTTH